MIWRSRVDQWMERREGAGLRKKYEFSSAHKTMIVQWPSQGAKLILDTANETKGASELGYPGVSRNQ